MGWKDIFGRIGRVSGKVAIQVIVPIAETYFPPSKLVVDKLIEATKHHGETFDAKSFLKSALPIAMAEIQDVPQFNEQQIMVIHAIVEAAFASGRTYVE